MLLQEIADVRNKRSLPGDARDENEELGPSILCLLPHEYPPKNGPKWPVDCEGAGLARGIGSGKLCCQSVRGDQQSQQVTNQTIIEDGILLIATKAIVTFIDYL